MMDYKFYKSNKHDGIVIEGEFNTPLDTKLDKKEKENTMMKRNMDKMKELKTRVTKFTKKHKVVLGAYAATFGAFAGVIGVTAYYNIKRRTARRNNTNYDSILPTDSEIEVINNALLDMKKGSNEELNEDNNNAISITEEIDDTITEDFDEAVDDIVEN